jgi:xylulose-5-phosphate/fructose-6-phosphate phosphoketolase
MRSIRHNTAIRSIQADARNGEVSATRRQFPILILRSSKGWTCPKELDGKPLAGSFRSHQVPIKEPSTNPAHLSLLEKWLSSYRPRELFTGDGNPNPQLLSTCPQGKLRMGMNPHAFGGKLRKELRLPDFRRYSISVTQHGGVKGSDTKNLGKYLRDVVRHNGDNFRIVCPDEMESNRLGAVFEATDRQFAWPTDAHDDHVSHTGRVLEVLSEHTCQGWLQGYLLTGRHGLFPSYEAFAPIADSMLNQYAKLLKVSAEISWRRPVSSFTYLLSSEDGGKTTTDIRIKGRASLTTF